MIDEHCLELSVRRQSRSGDSYRLIFCQLALICIARTATWMARTVQPSVTHLMIWAWFIVLYRLHSKV